MAAKPPVATARDRCKPYLLKAKWSVGMGLTASSQQTSGICRLCRQLCNELVLM